MVRDMCSVNWFALLACLKFMDRVILVQEYLFFSSSFLSSPNDKADQGKKALPGFQINRMKKQRQPREENKGCNKR